MTWPKKVGRGWNTSDRMRFFDEGKAIAHQARVDDADDIAGTHGRAYEDDALDEAPVIFNAEPIDETDIEGGAI